MPGVGAAGAHGSEAVREKREGNHVGKTPRQSKLMWQELQSLLILEGGAVGGGVEMVQLCVCIMGHQNNLQATPALFSKPCGP